MSARTLRGEAARLLRLAASKRRKAKMVDELDVLATQNIGKMWDRMLGEFLGEWERLQRQQLSPKELERRLAAFLDGLSPKPMEDLARQSSNVAYNEGRSAGLLTAADSGGAQFVLRSELLDSNTCEVCEEFVAFPVIVQVDSPEFYEFSPPAKCLGGDRCRGFWVAVPRAA